MNYEMFLGIGFLAVLGWTIVKDVISQARTDKLLNRIMAKNYEEFKYYEHKYPGDLKELQTVREESRVDKKDFVEQELFTEGTDAGMFEEDWAPDELDAAKMASMRKEE